MARGMLFSLAAGDPSGRPPIGIKQASGRLARIQTNNDKYPS
jgi:hypothetical protein